MKVRAWGVAVVAWLLAVAVTVALADNGSGVGGFSWAQVCVLVAVGAAWGDLRSQVKGHGERIKALEDRDK